MTRRLITTLSLYLLISLSSFSENASEKNEVTQIPTLNSEENFIGGTTLLVEIEPNTSEQTGDIIPLTPKVIDRAKKILEQRLNDFEAHSTSVSTQGNRLEFIIPKMEQNKLMELRKILTTTAHLTIHKRHPQSEQLADLVAAGEDTAPGYRAYPKEIKDENGKVIGIRHVLVARRPALTGKQIAEAWPDRASNSMVMIELTPAGTKQMETFTRGLKSGKDHIVSELDGKVINDAILNADVLSKYFSISGLDNIQEC